MDLGGTILSAFIKLVFDKLSSTVLNDLGVLWGLNSELGKLQSTLSIIRDVVEDAEERQVKEKAVSNWLRKLKDVAYEADDILDEFATEALRKKVEIQDGVVNKVRSFTSLSNPLVFRFKMGNKVKEIGDKLDKIAAERLKFDLKVGVAEPHVRGGERQVTDSFVIESEIYGRDEDKESMVELLIATSNQENVTIIPIIGMGGLGKTTLAQIAYNDERVVGYFELRMWICVYDESDLRRLVQMIVESAIGERFDLYNLDVLRSRLHQVLGGKKFLIVLDDVWCEDHEISERLKILLRCGAKGSKIIVTTRSEKVASILGTSVHYHLKGLSNDDCWALFKQRAFGAGEENANLVAIGREIVKKCKGVPLAAKTLGGLMHFKRDENEWLSVKESEIWRLPQEASGILPALRLSYNHLPPHLKQCFAYCSVLCTCCFTMEKEELIQLWMAQGFIQSSELIKQMEDIGTEYMNDLLWRSFFQLMYIDDGGKQLRWTMHGLISDLARSVAGDECLYVVANSAKGIPTTTRHLALDVGASSTIPEALLKANKLRTLIFWVSTKSIKEVPKNLFVSLRCLRALDLGSTGIKILPSSIGKLKHLRYLNLSKMDFETLPKSITSLLNLQTLNLSGCCHLRELPKDMSKMVSLRHLDINGCDFLTHMPAKIGQLSCLQTLPMFVVGEERGHTMGELKSLNLRGNLNIKNLKNVRNAVDAKEANLKEKRRLFRLRLSWDHSGDANLKEDVEQVIEGLKPHPSLKSLHIKDYGGVKFPSWMMDSSLSNLFEIALIGCRRCEHLPPLGQLCFLKVLIINGMEAVKCVDSIVGGFPLLEQLTLVQMPNLEKWLGVGDTEVFPRLAKLVLVKCPKLTTLPSIPSLKVLELRETNVIRSQATNNSLSSLDFGGFSELMSLPEGLLLDTDIHLDSLKVLDCPKLSFLPKKLENLPKLKNLGIIRCEELLSIPKLNYLERLYVSGRGDLIACLPEECIQGLSSLKNLFISYCRNLKALPEAIQNFTALEDLWIEFCPKLESLPEGLQHITTLRGLRIRSCENLASLPEWLGNLASLTELQICSCPNIMSLPMGLQRITALERLWIEDCPHLERRCEKDTGMDWHKISHIPNIIIKAPEIL